MVFSVMDIILVLLSFAPGLIIVFFIYYQDIHEPEPLPLVLFSLGLGVISLVITYGIDYILYDHIRVSDDTVVSAAFHAFVLVACVEEGSKFFFLRAFLFRSQYFNEPFDGIVYSVMIGMGFAMTENVFYVFEGGVGTAIVRMFTAVPAHAAFGVVMGFFLGKSCMIKKNDFKFSFIGVLAAILMHGIYDFFLFLSFVPGIWAGAFISLIIGIYYGYAAIRIHQEASPFQPDIDDDEIVMYTD